MCIYLRVYSLRVNLKKIIYYIHIYVQYTHTPHTHTKKSQVNVILSLTKLNLKMNIHFSYFTLKCCNA